MPVHNGQKPMAPLVLPSNVFSIITTFCSAVPKQKEFLKVWTTDNPGAAPILLLFQICMFSVWKAMRITCTWEHCSPAFTAQVIMEQHGKPLTPVYKTRP